MHAQSITQRMQRGLGGLAALILILAVLAVSSALFLLGAFERFQTKTIVTGAANRIAEDIFEAQIAADAYRRVASEALAAEVFSNIEEIEAEKERLRERDGISPEIRAQLEEIVALKSEYKEGFAGVSVLRDARAEALAAVFSEGNAAQATLSELLNASNRAGDAGQTFSAARVQQNLLQSRVYLERYILTGSAELFDRAASFLRDAEQQLSWMATMPGDASRTALFETLASDIARYVAAADRLNELTEAREAGFATMQANVADIMGATDILVDGLTTQQAEAGTTIKSTFVYTVYALSAAAGLALLYALIMTRRTVRSVRRDFETTLNTVSELSNGNLEVAIEGTDRQTELGSIARALEVFRTKSKEAAELTRQTEAAQKQAAEEKQRRADEERRVEHKRQLAEQDAAERHKREIFAALSAAVSGVVTAAAAGDFTGRVDATSLDRELAGFAAEINRLMANVERGLGEISSVSARLAAGDLRTGMSGEFEGTFKALQDNIEAMILSLGQLLGQVSYEAEGVAAQSKEMTTGAEDLARRAESQAASLEQTSATINEIASSSESNAASANETNEAAATMNDEAGRAREVLGSTISAMRDIEDGSKEIEAIVDVIEDIAFQTNLLSLNASVEAARAGEAGKGFAVVANEVRALAQRSAEASSKVQSIISQSTGAISRGSAAVEQTGEALEKIVERIGTVSGNLKEIKSASDEQATAVKDVSNAFSQLDKITQRNAAVAEQTRGTASLLSAQAQRMQEAVGKVRLRATPSSESPVAKARMTAA
ncbi:MAG: methyl-accepting chemotaxis protein [Pseudomonadota bacterium]